MSARVRPAAGRPRWRTRTRARGRAAARRRPAPAGTLPASARVPPRAGGGPHHLGDLVALVEDAADAVVGVADRRSGCSSTRSRAATRRAPSAASARRAPRPGRWEHVLELRARPCARCRSSPRAPACPRIHGCLLGGDHGPRIVVEDVHLRPPVDRCREAGVQAQAERHAQRAGPVAGGPSGCHVPVEGADAFPHGAATLQELERGRGRERHSAGRDSRRVYGELRGDAPAGTRVRYPVPDREGRRQEHMQQDILINWSAAGDAGRHRRERRGAGAARRAHARARPGRQRLPRQGGARAARHAVGLHRHRPGARGVPARGRLWQRQPDGERATARSSSRRCRSRSRCSRARR